MAQLAAALPSVRAAIRRVKQSKAKQSKAKQRKSISGSGNGVGSSSSLSLADGRPTCGWLAVLPARRDSARRAGSRTRGKSERRREREREREKEAPRTCVGVPCSSVQVRNRWRTHGLLLYRSVLCQPPRRSSPLLKSGCVFVHVVSVESRALHAVCFAVGVSEVFAEHIARAYRVSNCE